MTEENFEMAEAGVLARINQRLRDWFLPGTKLTQQEETIMNIIYKILNAPGTIKLTPKSGARYLINDSLHYYVKLSGNRVSIINSVDSIIKDCSGTFEMFVTKIVDEALARDIEKIDATLFTNEMKLLEKIESKVVE